MAGVRLRSQTRRYRHARRDNRFANEQDPRNEKSLFAQRALDNHA